MVLVLKVHPEDTVDFLVQRNLRPHGLLCCSILVAGFGYLGLEVLKKVWCSDLLQHQESSESSGPSRSPGPGRLIHPFVFCHKTSNVLFIPIDFLIRTPSSKHVLQQGGCAGHSGLRGSMQLSASSSLSRVGFLRG